MATAREDEEDTAVPPPPFLDRGIIVDPDSLAVRTLDECGSLLQRASSTAVSAGWPAAEACNRILHAHVWLHLQSQAARLCVAVKDGDGRVATPCSTFMAACAFAWA